LPARTTPKAPITTLTTRRIILTTTSYFWWRNYTVASTRWPLLTTATTARTTTTATTTRRLFTTTTTTPFRRSNSTNTMATSYSRPSIVATQNFDPRKITPCNSTMNAIFYSNYKENFSARLITELQNVINLTLKKGPANDIFVLDENYKLWEYQIRKERWEQRDFFKLYPNLTEGVRGGSRCDQGLTWFFKGRWLWVYSDFTLLSGFPYRIPESIFPTHIYTSIWKDNKLYGIKVYSIDKTII
jgi:hypothetical protein